MQSHNIKLLLNIKDKNINIINVFENILNGVKSKVIDATLDYVPSNCPKCGSHHPKLLSKGFIKSIITLNKTAGFNSYLHLKKKRFTCKECNKTFTLDTELVNKNCFISNPLKHSIKLNLNKAFSMKDIASLHNVSYSTVARCIKDFDSLVDGHTYKDYLPKTLLFDEFKSVNNISGKMSFIFLDGDTHNIIDIVENRQKHYLIDYFSYYSKDARDSVETIVIDMYQPYIQLIKEMFVNAKIVFDKFHIIQHLNRAFNKARIDLMKKDKVNYNKLKRYWKLLLKKESELNPIRYFYSMCFKENITDTKIVDYLVNLDDEFKASYDYYQSFIQAIEYKDSKKINYLLDNVPDNISFRLKQALKSLQDNKEYIINAIESEYTNGPIEGINNKIKLLKRVAYGFRSFRNFKVRIMLHFNLYKDTSIQKAT